MNRSLLDLTQLRSFIVLAELLHFGRAAKALRIAQPALSQQIRKLEHARSVFEDMDRAVHSAKQIADGGAGTLTVGYVALAMLTSLPAVLRRFRDEFPDVEVQLREMSTAPQLEALQTGSIDIAIVSGIPVDPDIVVHQLSKDPFVALIPGSHSAARKRSLTASALRDSPFIMFPKTQAPELHDRIIHLCRKAGFEPSPGQEAQSWHTIGELVGAGMGVSIAPRSVERYRIPNVRCVPVRPPEYVTVNICHIRENRSKLVEHFMKLAQRHPR